MRLKALFLSICLVGIAHDAGAQTRTSSIGVAPGSRVRVKTPSLVAPLEANFLEQRGDTLVFIEDGLGRGVWSFDISQIERLETTAGEAGRNTMPILKSAGIGAGVGLVAGILFASLASPSDDTKEYSTIMTGGLGAVIGGGIGAIVGSRVKTERWVNVPLTRRQLSLVTNGRSIGLSLSISGSR